MPSRKNSYNPKGNWRSWKNGATIIGVTHYMGTLYAVTFMPLQDVVAWRVLEEKDCATYGLTVEQYRDFDAKNANNKSDVAAPGFIQNAVVARLFDHLIHMAMVLDQDSFSPDGEPPMEPLDNITHFDYNSVREFYKGYRMIKISAIKKQPCANLCRANIHCMNTFVSALAGIDHSVSWAARVDRNGRAKMDGGVKTIRLIGQPSPHYFGGGFQTVFEYEVAHWTSEWRVNGDDYMWFSRAVFESIVDMGDRYQRIINAKMAQKEAAKKEVVGNK